MVFLKKATFILVIISSLAQASWVGNALNSSVQIEDAGYFTSQAGGHISLGSGKIRFAGGNGVIKPFHVVMPSMSIGCSGIDMALGAFSYLNLDQIGEKLRKITAAAPAFAFKMALSTLCKDCDTIMTELENIANAINSINFDTCEAMTNWSKKLSDSLSSQISQGGGAKGWNDGWKNIGQGVQQGAAATTNAISKFNSWINGNANTTANNEKPAALLFEQGSFIKYVIKNSNSSSFGTILGNDYEDIIRGLLGDVVGYTDFAQNPATEKSIFIPPNISDKQFVEYLWGGEFKFPLSANQSNTLIPLKFQPWKITQITRGDWEGRYTKPEILAEKTYNGESYKRLMYEKFNKIIEALKSKSSIQQDSIAFMNSLQMSSLHLLANHVVTGANINPYIDLIILEPFADLIKQFIQEITSNINSSVSGKNMNEANLNLLLARTQKIENQLAQIIHNIQVDSKNKIDTLNKIKDNQNKTPSTIGSK